jgi:hypothetical protein
MGLLNRILTGESRAEEAARLAGFRERADEYKGKASEARSKLNTLRRQQREDRQSRYPDPAAFSQLVAQAEREVATLEHNERTFRSWAEGK